MGCVSRLLASLKKAEAAASIAGFGWFFPGIEYGGLASGAGGVDSEVAGFANGITFETSSKMGTS